jgi:hypothetical protein
MRALMKGVCGTCPACMLLWLLSNVSLVELLLLPINSTQSCCSLQSSLPMFFLIALARQCVRLGLKKMMPVQNGLPRRVTTGVGGAVHGGIGADLGEGKVLSVGQPRGVARGDVTGGGGSAHCSPYRDVEAVGIDHSVLTWLACARSYWRRCP